MNNSPFSSNVHFTHLLWDSPLENGDCIIDATCGNGHDSLWLAKRLPRCKQSKLFCIDKQKIAIDSTRARLQGNLTEECFNQIVFVNDSHETFPQICSELPIRLIVYNLGYLPGEQKSVTTTTNTSLISLQNALNLLRPGGIISVTCYIRHNEGKQETLAIETFAKNLPKKHFTCLQTTWINRQAAPSIILIQKNT